MKSQIILSHAFAMHSQFQRNVSRQLACDLEYRKPSTIIVAIIINSCELLQPGVLLSTRS